MTIGGNRIKKIPIGMLLLIILFPSLLFAQANIEATGFDWIEYTPPQKQGLVNALYHILKVDGKVETGVILLDHFYFISYKAIAADPSKNVSAVYNALVMKVLADLVIYEDEYPAKMMEIYGLVETT